MNPPQEKTNIVEVPGSSTSLDISDALTSYPTYKDRTGSFSFYVENGYKDWHDMYSTVLRYLHGKKMRFILNDDPYFFYEGRLSVDSWASNKERSTIVISYILNAYKKSIFSSCEAMIWDLFNFDDGIDYGTMFSGSYNSSGNPVGIKLNKPIKTYSNPDDAINDSSSFVEIVEPGLTDISSNAIDIMPVNPVFRIYKEGSNSGAQIFLNNPEVKDPLSSFTNKSNRMKILAAESQSPLYDSIRDPEYTFSGFAFGTYDYHSMNHSMNLWLQGGSGTDSTKSVYVTVIFRRGRL